MKPKYYDIISGAVEVGVTIGLNRAYKHAETPEREIIEQRIVDAIMSELCDRFTFTDEAE